MMTLKRKSGDRERIEGPMTTNKKEILNGWGQRRGKKRNWGQWWRKKNGGSMKMKEKSSVNEQRWKTKQQNGAERA